MNSTHPFHSLTSDKTSYLLVKSGVILIAIAMLTGILVAFSMTGVVNANPQYTLASHLNALFGGLILIALGLTKPFFSLSSTWFRAAALLLVISSFGNWLLTAIRSFLFVDAIGFNGNAINDFMHLLLVVIVVLPAIIGSLIWVFGFKKS